MFMGGMKHRFRFVRNAVAARKVPSTLFPRGEIAFYPAGIRADSACPLMSERAWAVRRIG
jgi:hypothetical protein